MLKMVKYGIFVYWGGRPQPVVALAGSGSSTRVYDMLLLEQWSIFKGTY